MRGALTQADISSWIVAGAYTTRVPARHRYDLGLSYSTQRYDGGNPLALRDVTDGSRNVGAVYGFDTFTLTPALAVTYGGRYARYDYLDSRSLLQPARRADASRRREHFRVSARASRAARSRPAPRSSCRRSRTASGCRRSGRSRRSIDGQSASRPSAPTHCRVEVERDFGGSTVSVRAFRQQVDDQLVTMFGVEIAGRAARATRPLFRRQRRRRRRDRLRRRRSGRRSPAAFTARSSIR